MPRPRYSANKRAREISKRQERARKLARKHNRTAQRAASEGTGTSTAPDVQTHAAEAEPPAETAGDPESAPEEDDLRAE